MLNLTSQQLTDVRNAFSSPEMGRATVSMLNNSEEIRETTEILFCNLAVRLFEGLDMSMPIDFEPEQTIAINGEELPIGSIMVAIGTYINMCTDKQVLERICHKLNEKLSTSTTIDFTSICFAGALRNQKVIDGKLALWRQLTGTQPKITQEAFIHRLAQILVNLTENNRGLLEHLSNEKRIFSEDASFEEKTYFVYLLLLENIDVDRRGKDEPVDVF